jgi:hypothetical protein
MINLIPPGAKKKLLLEYWSRVISSWLILWSLILFLSSLLLLPVYVLLDAKVTVFTESAEQASSKVEQFRDTSDSLLRASQQARFIVDEDRRPKLSSYITLLQNLESNQIQISNISMSRGEVGLNPIRISGLASNRQSLANFRDELVAIEGVSEVELPISNLARDSDIPFNLSIIIDNQTEL